MLGLWQCTDGTLPGRKEGATVSRAPGEGCSALGSPSMGNLLGG